VSDASVVLHERIASSSGAEAVRSRSDAQHRALTPLQRLATFSAWDTSKQTRLAWNWAAAWLRGCAGNRTCYESPAITSIAGHD